MGGWDNSVLCVEKKHSTFSSGSECLIVGCGDTAQTLTVVAFEDAQGAGWLHDKNINGPELAELDVGSAEDDAVDWNSLWSVRAGGDHCWRG